MADLQVISSDLLVSVILDQSGSMRSCKAATIAGFNEYVESLRSVKADGKISMSLTKFSGQFSAHVLVATSGDPLVRNDSNGVQIVYADKPLADVPLLSEETYRPDGGTPLYDAIGRTIKATQEAIQSKGTSPRVVVVVITDGENTHSSEYTRDQAVSMIKEREAAGWTFVYLGADQDAWRIGESLGFSRGNTASYNSEGTKSMYRGLAESTMTFAAAGASSSPYFTEEQREALKKAIDKA